MKKTAMAVVALLVGFGGLAGCATTASVVHDKDDGSSQVYQVNTTQAWEIAKTVFRWQGGEDIEEHRPKGYLLARSGATWVPWGSMMVAWIDQVDGKKTKVTVVTKRRIGDVGTNSSEEEFHKRFADAVKIVKAGKRLPAEPPKQK